jgi:hypothetical protein
MIKIRKTILTIISLISILLLSIAYSTFQEKPSDVSVWRIMFFIVPPLWFLGIIRLLISMSVKNSKYFRFQEFIFGIAILIQIFSFQTGDVISVICISVASIGLIYGLVEYK